MSDVTALSTPGAISANPSARYYVSGEHHPENGTLLGFWLYLMSDCLLFAALFAVYGVLGRSFAAGQRTLSDHGIPTPRELGTVRSFAELQEGMRQSGCTRVFIKLAHGSSASGVVAFQTTGEKHQAITTVEMVSQGSELHLYNSRRIRILREIREIEVLVDALCRHRVYVEHWLPKAGIMGRTFDLRVVVIAGQAKQTVVRLSRHSITNLQLLGGRGSLDPVMERMGDEAWVAMRHTCEQVMTNCFGDSLYAGIDLRVAPDFRRHHVLEVNAFGDLLPGVVSDGLDTYGSEISAMLDEGRCNFQGAPGIFHSQV